MKILVTGGLGFVGINLVRYLAHTLPEVQVIAADVMTPDERIQTFLAPVTNRVSCTKIDVTERPFVEYLVRSMGITHIVHAAAITPGTEREQRQPTQIVDVNLVSAINVLDVAIRTETVERVVLLSSSGVYGPATTTIRTQPEDSPLQLDNLYSITKYSAELLGARYAELSGKPIVSARLAAPFGPLERPTGSREHMGQPQRLLAALRNGQPITVAGANVVRDWTYIDDTAEAIRLLLTTPRLTQPVYNVSCGVAVRFAQVVEAFVAHGLQTRWIDDEEQAHIAMQPHQRRAPLDIARLHTDTGFAPRYDIRSGIAAYVQSEP